MQDFVELVSKHLTRLINVEDSHNSELLFVEKVSEAHFLLLTKDKNQGDIDGKELLIFLINSVQPEKVQ
jgi:hypothetical protein